ncbi:MAG: glycosyl transferase [Akkermansiaceae bacterium]|nr:glycosyl transferase [Akkermansiaceae bacterium]
MMLCSNRARILSNGTLRSLLLPGGQGGLFFDWVALTRFSETAHESCGPMIYVREGTERNPTRLSTTLDAGIHPTFNLELRKITLTNHASHTREIELTTYSEISLNHPLGDAGHPAFSKLFVQTSTSQDTSMLLARRRPRGLNERWPWVAQKLITPGKTPSWETNRATFLGRGNTRLEPAAMDSNDPLSGETGNVLDPIMAWRTHVSLGPHESQHIWLLTAAAEDEASVTEILHRVSCAMDASHLLDDAKATDAARLNSFGLPTETASRYEALSIQMLIGTRHSKAPKTLDGSDVVHRFPLAWDEIRVVATAGLTSPGTQDFLAALPFWKALGLKIKGFIMDQAQGSDLPDEITLTDPTTFTDAERSWWLASAQLVVGSEITQEILSKTNEIPPTTKQAPDSQPDLDETLQHFNGYGGFSQSGREYVIPMALENGRLHLPPMPWVNVLANPNFGCIVTDRGAGYTWSRNSQANRLTPWSNDPIRDPHVEALYLMDSESGDVWSPLPGPCAARSAFVVRHGFGMTRFLSSHSGLTQSVKFLVPPADPIKLITVRIRNDSSRPRHLAFAAYQALEMGSNPDRHHAAFAWTAPNKIQHAVNPRAGDFAGGRIFSFVKLHGAFSMTDETMHSTAAFLGAGDMAEPLALNSNIPWNEQPGFGHDACFARKISFTLPPRTEVEIVVALGEVMNDVDIRSLADRYQLAGAIDSLEAEVAKTWQQWIGNIHVRTPLPEVDLMVNGWLIYQNLTCRIWGRSAFYQSGGAYGFRDQLQDSGAMVALHPELMRKQILLHAAQQFPEGDVTHWWHPEPMGRGMRTKFADDLLWLPYLTDHYLQVTGDYHLLEETRHFIEGPLLSENEDEEYLKPRISAKQASIFEHCCLAIDKSLTRGAHGLPLMGIGDWNDGMSRIGREGRGESVWMGFFLFTILNRWIPLCEARGELIRANAYREYRDELLTAINDAGWDGEWYRRAYYDDGTPLGTHTDDECRIDALAQAWAVISKAAPADRAKKSLDSLNLELIDRDHDIIRLLHPPFVNTAHDPGYIKGYVAGVRENGGQYTHAACWVIRAMAEAGRKDEAAELLQRLSPIWHSRDADAVARYQVEPYVVAADIYGTTPHIGRGGWTWYTGSAGWMFRVTVESILGLRMENGDSLVLDPRVPDSWPGFSIDFKTPSGQTLYQIQVTNPYGNSEKVFTLTVDGVAMPVVDSIARWPMLDDGKNHAVTIVLGAGIPD